MLYESNFTEDAVTTFTSYQGTGALTFNRGLTGLEATSYLEF